MTAKTQILLWITCKVSIYLIKHFKLINAELQMSYVNWTQIHNISVISQPIFTLDHRPGSSHRDDSSQGPNTEILDFEILNTDTQWITCNYHYILLNISILSMQSSRWVAQIQLRSILSRLSLNRSPRSTTGPDRLIKTIPARGQTQDLKSWNTQPIWGIYQCTPENRYKVRWIISLWPW